MSRFSQIFSPPIEVDIHSNDSTNRPRSTVSKPQKRHSMSNMLHTLLSPKTKKTGASPTRIRSFSMRSSWSLSTAPNAEAHKPIVLHPPFAGHATSIDSLPSHKQRAAMRDSAFSLSIASSDSGFYTACHSLTRSTRSSTASSTSEVVTVVLSEAQLRKLRSLVRRATRGVKKQEWLTQGLSMNLAVMLARKEASVELNRRMAPQWKVQMRDLCLALRTLVGRTFMRKAVFTQRSLQVLQGLEELMGGMKEGENLLDVDGLLSSLVTLKDDLSAQEAFDGALGQGIAGPCGEKRFRGSEGERVVLERFLGFLDGRLKGLGECYGRTRGRVEEIEGLVGGLKIVEG